MGYYNHEIANVRHLPIKPLGTPNTTYLTLIDYQQLKPKKHSF